MGVSQHVLVILAASLTSLVAGRDRYLQGPNQYTECVYNSYKAVCLGYDIRRLDHVDAMMQQFPTLNNNENCLMLPGNLIRKFPDDLRSIKQLRTLDLSRNMFESLPDDLDLLENLEILDMSENRLRTLSPRTRFPHLLRSLLLAKNQMDTIPAGIEIPGLFVFDLSNNNFKEIPYHFCVSNQLIRVDLTKNKLQHDISHYTNTLNRCTNINEVPFCLFTDRLDFRCDCPTLYPIFFDDPTFCMGTKSLNTEMSCANTSADKFQQTSLYRLDRRLDFVQENCSFSLRMGSNGGSWNKARPGHTAFFATVVFLVTLRI